MNGVKVLMHFILQDRFWKEYTGKYDHLYCHLWLANLLSVWIRLITASLSVFTHLTYKFFTLILSTERFDWCLIVSALVVT